MLGITRAELLLGKLQLSSSWYRNVKTEKHHLLIRYWNSMTFFIFHLLPMLYIGLFQTLDLMISTWVLFQLCHPCWLESFWDKSLPKMTWNSGYEKPGVNFTNILWAAFSYKSFLRSFYVLTIWVCNFWRKEFGAKAAHKMLVKLTPG